MCLTNELATILLLLLTILIATMPTITTTSSTLQLAGRPATDINGSSGVAGVGITTATKATGKGGGAAVGAGEGFIQQQQQLQRLHGKSLVLEAHPAEFPSSGTQLLPPGHDDNFIASLVGVSHNNNNNNNNNNGNNGNGENGGNLQYNPTLHHSTLNRHHPNHHTLNIDYNGLDLQSADGEDDESSYPPPVFDFGMPRNITARSGQIAAINCRVENLGDKSVSWIRKRDLHILTAGILTYTSDERFKVIRTADSKDWTLHVKYAQPRDSGIYECQVNTEPKISMAFRLNVIVTPPDAKAIIAGPTDLYVKVGSAITLTCHVKQPSSAQDIGPIYWYRGPYILTPFVAHPNDAAIDLQRISMESKLGEKLQSRLRIANAQTADSGNYTCMPTTADAASVMVNVINDESPAAMQKSDASSRRNVVPLLIGCSAVATRILSANSNIVTFIVTITTTVVRWMQQQHQHQQRQHQQQHQHIKQLLPLRTSAHHLLVAATSLAIATMALLSQQLCYLFSTPS